MSTVSSGEVHAVAHPDAGRFAVEEWRGAPAALHATDAGTAPGQPRAIWCVATAPALVLGSAQPDATVDVAACARHDLAVARRRSGGGAVLVVPGEIVWLDVLVPRGDPLWSDDVGRAMWWLGELWADVLRELEPGAHVGVHRGPLERTPWSSVVCFDGLGAGEVVVDGAKAVGISQRRRRDVARLQSSLHLRWRPDVVVDVLAPPRPAVGDLRPVHAIAADAARVRALVTARLATR